ncbi:ribose-phosphate pyrophosphokinase 4-like [Paramuricea clavata]|uniref:Ribose-phosphate pyrophosphokinase 4-like n=1 Tax=Paramuricea clavata TaxID=317549 RepID=A0A7D9HG23_PARCT|nr:ribose-phosphate pyrophosphokinase 4-like [Paramuricea clavata]
MENDVGSVLFYHNSMEKLAKSIAEHCQCKSGGKAVNLKHDIQWKSFEDGWPNLFIENVKDNCAGRDVIFLGSFHSPEVVFEQLSIVYNIPRYLARSFTFILPYFPTGTMERVDKEGQIATAKTLSRMISSIPLTARGPAQVVIYDIHCLQERFYFSDDVIPRLETAIPLLLAKLKTFPDKEKISIAFPDEGAFKRFHTQFEEYPTIICIKQREGNKRIVKIKDGEPDSRHVIIVDDLIKTGGTILECAKALKKAGATKISAYVTHGVFPQESWKRFTASDVPFENFFITDSLPYAEEIVKHRPFQLLSLTTAIAEALLGFDLKQS